MSQRRLLLAGLALSVSCAGCGAHAATHASAGSSPATTPGSAAPGSASSAPSAGSTPSAPASLVPVPERVTETKAAVAMSATSTFRPQVTARITGHTATSSVAHGPGQIGGAPSVAFTVEIDNGTGTPLPLDGVTVTASYGAAAVPATLSDGSTAFSGQLRARSKATGTYVFEIPVEDRGAVTVTVNYSATEPTVVFTGAVT